MSETGRKFDPEFPVGAVRIVWLCGSWRRWAGDRDGLHQLRQGEHKIPVRLSCRALGVRESWYDKHRDRPPTPRQSRRVELAAAVRAAFDASGGTYGSPRLALELGATGGVVSENTVTELMPELGLVARVVHRRLSLTRPGSHHDPHRGRLALPGHRARPVLLPAAWYAMSAHHDAGLTAASLHMAAATAA